MALRDCALRCEAFSALHDAYADREKAALAWKERGGKVVGTLGADVPEEILIAAGFLPVRCYADPDRPLKYADVYLEQAYEPSSRATFERIVDGTCDGLFDHLAISHTSDTELRMWLYLREMRRSERQMRVPPVEFVDWLLVRRRMYQEENKNVVARFRDAVEKWIGRAIDDDEIRDAARILNDDHAALREVAALRRLDKPRVNGSEALVIIGSAFFMDRAEHAKLARQVAEEAQAWPEIDAPRVFVTGTAQESTELYGLIEDAGAVVVGEDHDWGDRSYDRDMRCGIDVTRAIVDRYMLRSVSCRRSLVADRVRELDAQVAAANAQAVVFYLHEHDEAASWDYPEQRKSLEAGGIAAKAFFRQQWPASKNEALAGDLVAFADELKARA